MSEGWGADVVALRDLGRRMNEDGTELESIRAHIDSALRYCHWEGQDGEQFRMQWNAYLTGLLRTATDALRAAATAVQRNAAEQEQASGLDRGSGGDASVWDPKNWVTVGAPTTADGLSGPSDQLEAFSFGLGLTSLGVSYLNSSRGAADLADLAERSPTLARFAAEADPYVTAGIFAVDLQRLATDQQADPNSDETWNDRADLFFDSASAVASVDPEWKFGVDVVHTAYDIGTYFDPGLTHQIVDTYQAVSKTVADVGGAMVSGFETGTKAVGDVISGGWNAVTSWF